jgi:hypothetical protein
MRVMDGSPLSWGLLLLSVALASVTVVLLRAWRSRNDDEPVDFDDVI